MDKVIFNGRIKGRRGRGGRGETKAHYGHTCRTLLPPRKSRARGTLALRFSSLFNKIRKACVAAPTRNIVSNLRLMGVAESPHGKRKENCKQIESYDRKARSVLTARRAVPYQSNSNTGALSIGKVRSRQLKLVNEFRKVSSVAFLTSFKTLPRETKKNRSARRVRIFALLIADRDQIERDQKPRASTVVPFADNRFQPGKNQGNPCRLFLFPTI